VAEVLVLLITPMAILEIRCTHGFSDIQLPADLVAAAKLDEGGDVSLEAAKLIALDLFREDEISLGRAAELCRMPIQASRITPASVVLLEKL
jgi:hypothetical protein